MRSSVHFKILWLSRLMISWPVCVSHSLWVLHSPWGYATGPHHSSWQCKQIWVCLTGTQSTVGVTDLQIMTMGFGPGARARITWFCLVLWFTLVDPTLVPRQSPAFISSLYSAPCLGSSSAPCDNSWVWGMGGRNRPLDARLTCV